MTQHQAIAGLLLAVAYAMADRAWGGGFGAWRGKKAVIFAALVGGGFMLDGWPLAVLGLLWCGYRSQEMRGAITEWRQAAARHGVYALVIVAFLGGRETLIAGVSFGLYAALATSLAWAYGQAETEARDRVWAQIAGGIPFSATDASKAMASFNARIEFARGAVHGLAAFTAFILQAEGTVH